jgi:outer membrane receptor for ferric coprogen and ferric-rhodotorulic acid
MEFAVSWADLRYAKNTHALCYPGRTPDGSRPGTCTLSGEHPIQAPEWETHLGLRYRLPTGWGGFSARVDWSWTDDYNTSFSADPRLTQPAYSDISVHAAAQIGKACELTVWGANLLGETVSDFDSLLNLFNDASYQSYLAAPRSYGVTFRWTLR